MAKSKFTLLDLIDTNASSDDSEDEDFAPDAGPSKPSKRKTLGQNNDENTGESLPKKIKTGLSEEEVAEKKRKAQEEWQKLMQVEEETRKIREQGVSVQTSAEEADMVEIRRPRNYAGEVIYETVKVPRLHPDVEKYGSTTTPSTGISTIVTPESSAATKSLEPPLSTAKSKRSGPPKRRKPKQSLEDLNAALENGAAKKMTTFEKSQMDWKSLTSTDGSLSSELEANRKEGGGGFLEKQEFLGRVGERKELSREESGSSRRR